MLVVPEGWQLVSLEQRSRTARAVVARVPRLCVVGDLEWSWAAHLVDSPREDLRRYGRVRELADAISAATSWLGELAAVPDQPGGTIRRRRLFTP